MGALGVVVGGEGIQLGLQAGEGGGGVLAGEPFLQGLVEAFGFPTGLRVVGAAVGQADAQGGQLAFQRDPAAAAVEPCEDGPASWGNGAPAIRYCAEYSSIGGARSAR